MMARISVAAMVFHTSPHRMMELMHGRILSTNAMSIPGRAAVATLRATRALRSVSWGIGSTGRPRCRETHSRMEAMSNGLSQGCVASIVAKFSHIIIGGVTLFFFCYYLIPVFPTGGDMEVAFARYPVVGTVVEGLGRFFLHLEILRDYAFLSFVRGITNDNRCSSCGNDIRVTGRACLRCKTHMKKMRRCKACCIISCPCDFQ